MTEKSTNPLIPIGIVVSLPVLACLLIMLTDEGVNRSLLWAAVKVGILLIVLGGALSYGASRLAAKSER
ncbi:conserved hypothetical protein [Methylobacterium sp. 4-46]|uniref:hypothetical protein n=1 Tax=unclassified Methylobacterium TaxID=2615210 RepID=UPI000152E16C|nr:MULTISPECIES: hypothetical protein [Methylobacterium]ACA19233.1 conserved hypothetical protein [Methylobacterium sp. 4-46]WFT78439.1 hypothetical protein QA634_24650 [Methylobacterium nodulans]